MRDVGVAITEWAQAKLLTPKQVEKLRAFEAARVPSVVVDHEGRPARGSLVAEAVGYLGAALAVTAVVLLLGESWDDMALPARLGVIGALALAFGVGGLVVARARTSAMRRLADTLMTVGVGFAAWDAGLAASDWLGWDARATTVAAGAVATLLSGALYLARRSGLPQFALLVSLWVLAAGLVPDRFMWATLAWWAIGLLWMLLAMLGARPRRALSTTGALATLVAAQLMAFDFAFGGGDVWPLALGVATAIGVMVLAVRGADNTPMLVLGTVGLLVLLPQLASRLFGGSGAVLSFLLLAGVALVAFAVWMGRRGRD